MAHNSDFYELDFLDVETEQSGDAIALRYRVNGISCIHVVDGGFQVTGEKVVNHIRKHYGSQSYIDNVVVTHPDGDHAGGLRSVLEEMPVLTLWMLRPWMYADELIHRFANYTSAEHLRRRLKEVYPNLAALEKIALEKGIPIREPFQGWVIGAFRVLAPTKERYLDLIVQSERTPEAEKTRQAKLAAEFAKVIGTAFRAAINYVKSAWGAETFSPEETSAENEMSVVQYANLCGKRILLTGDAGRGGLSEAAYYVPYIVSSDIEN